MKIDLGWQEPVRRRRNAAGTDGRNVGEADADDEERKELAKVRVIHRALASISSLHLYRIIGHGF